MQASSTALRHPYPPVWARDHLVASEVAGYTLPSKSQWKPTIPIPDRIFLSTRPESVRYEGSWTKSCLCTPSYNSTTSHRISDYFFRLTATANSVGVLIWMRPVAWTQPLLDFKFYIPWPVYPCAVIGVNRVVSCDFIQSAFIVGRSWSVSARPGFNEPPANCASHCPSGLWSWTVLIVGQWFANSWINLYSFEFLSVAILISVFLFLLRKTQLPSQVTTNEDYYKVNVGGAVC